MHDDDYGTGAALRMIVGALTAVLLIYAASAALTGYTSPPEATADLVAHTPD